MEFKSLIINAFSDYEVKSTISAKYERLIKDAELAKTVRMTATQMFTDTKHNVFMHEVIWDSYLNSIALAPNNSESLVLSYSNMSALLYHLCKYDDCIKDVDMALKITKLIPMKVKLLCRKAKCLKAIGNSEKDIVFQEAMSWLERIDENDVSKKELTRLVRKAKIIIGKDIIKTSCSENNTEPFQIQNIEAEVDQPEIETNQTMTICEVTSDQSDQEDSSQNYHTDVQHCKIENTSKNNNQFNIQSEAESIQTRIAQLTLQDNEAISDINKLLASGYNSDEPETQSFEVDSVKVIIRKVNCDKDEMNTENYITNSNIIPKEKKKKKYKKKKKKNIKKVYSADSHLEILAQKEAEGIFNSVTLSYNEIYGTHLVANRDIKPGEIIFVTKPYVLVPNFDKSQNFCNNCLRSVWSSIPCDNCACSMYCSEDCQKEAMEKFHSIECPILQFIIHGKHVLDYQIQVSLRALIMGIKEFGSITNLRNQMDALDNNDYEDFFSTDKFRPDSFISIFGFMIFNVDPEPLNHLAKSSSIATIALARFTSVFENSKLDTFEDFIENEHVIFIASLLLRIAVIVYSNGIKVLDMYKPCVKNDDKSICKSVMPCCERGYSFNTMYQFIPHSCDPNVKSLKTENCKELWYCLQPIYKGYPLLESYRSTFFELDLEKRYEETALVLHRYCTCIACEERWPAVLVVDDQVFNYERLFDLVLKSIEFENDKKRFNTLVQQFNLCHQSIVNELSEIIIASYEYFGQPSAELCAAICILQYTFRELYELRQNMPEKCRTLQE